MASDPCACGSQWRSIPKANGFKDRILLSALKRALRTMRAARFTMRTRYPWRSRYSASAEKPIGYISNTVVDGTRSLTGPDRMVSSRKSYTLGAWKRIRSVRGIKNPPTEIRTDRRSEKYSPSERTGPHQRQGQRSVYPAPTGQTDREIVVVLWPRRTLAHHPTSHSGQGRCLLRPLPPMRLVVRLARL